MNSGKLAREHSRAFWDGFFSVFSLGFGDYWRQSDVQEWPKLLTPQEARAVDAANIARDWKAVGGYLRIAMDREGASRV